MPTATKVERYKVTYDGRSMFVNATGHDEARQLVRVRLISEAHIKKMVPEAALGSPVSFAPFAYTTTSPRY
jgi:hypothetical protein